MYPGVLPPAPSVHPHARGEYEEYGALAQIPDGSSPRAWGIPHGVQCGVVCVRFIPTRVGNTGGAAKWPEGPPVHPHARYTRSSARIRAVESVHPHARGEYETQYVKRHGRTGSSPRAWGILIVTASLGGIVRFIPTRVGNTRLASTASFAGSVHPHARGEYTWYLLVILAL